MVNNSFDVIGICTSNFKDIGRGKYHSYLLRVEVEIFNSDKGNSFELEVQVYGTNKSVDVARDMLGEQVAITGYLDSYMTENGSLITKLVAQRIYILGEQKPKVVDAELLPDEPDEPDEQEEQPSKNADNLPDDDLPF